MGNEKRKTYRMINSDLSKELSHGICVSNLAYRIGKKLSLDEEVCYNLAVMGLLHDVGKQEMVRNIIQSGGVEPLRVEEMRYLRTHCTLGYAVLLNNGYPQEQAEWVLYHHENYDGSGYPSNRAGKDIPLGARIIRVCDVFAALTTRRSYRDAYPVKEAIEQMIGEAKNFDLKVFLALMDIVHTTDPEELLDDQNLTIKFDDRRDIDEFEKETGNRYERYFSKGDGDS